MIYPAPPALSRSWRPFNGGGYVVLDKDYRGKGIYQATQSDFWDKLGPRYGYFTFTGRNALTAKTSIANQQVGDTFSAVVPNAIYVNKFGWLCDLINYRNQTGAELSKNDLMEVRYISRNLLKVELYSFFLSIHVYFCFCFFNFFYY